MLVIPLIRPDESMILEGQANEVVIPGELIVTVERHLSPTQDADGDHEYQLMFIKADGIGYKTHPLSLEKSADLMDQWFDEYRAMYPPKFLRGGK